MLIIRAMFESYRERGKDRRQTAHGIQVCVSKIRTI